MKVSKQAKRDAKQLFRSCLVNGVLAEDRVRQVVALVAAAKPRGYIAILSQFVRLVKLEVDRRTARVECAVPASPELRSDLQNRLSRLYGPGLDIQFAPNPALIGGLRIQVGSDVYDGSIQARLKALQESF